MGSLGALGKDADGVFGAADFLRQAPKFRSNPADIGRRLIEGDWGDKNFSRGCADGVISGIIPCDADRQEE